MLRAEGVCQKVGGSHTDTMVACESLGLDPLFGCTGGGEEVDQRAPVFNDVAAVVAAADEQHCVAVRLAAREGGFDGEPSDSLVRTSDPVLVEFPNWPSLKPPTRSCIGEGRRRPSHPSSESGVSSGAGLAHSPDVPSLAAAIHGVERRSGFDQKPTLGRIWAAFGPQAT